MAESFVHPIGFEYAFAYALWQLMCTQHSLHARSQQLHNNHLSAVTIFLDKTIQSRASDKHNQRPPIDWPEVK